MNVIFLDFDGVLKTSHYKSYDEVLERIKILADICHEYDCKVVISAGGKIHISEETLEAESDMAKYVFACFKVYGIHCIGRTPKVAKKFSDEKSVSSWKEDEIRLYLFRHPEVNHFCIIDDDTTLNKNSDLNKVRDYLVQTLDYSPDNSLEEGLLYRHKEEIGEVLKKENKIQKLLLKRRN